jgi:hypothetical protein
MPLYCTSREALQSTEFVLLFFSKLMKKFDSYIKLTNLTTFLLKLISRLILLYFRYIYSYLKKLSGLVFIIQNFYRIDISRILSFVII